jgi:hypothetical protein
MVLDQQTEKTGRPARNPVLAAALIIYGTFFLLLATMPGSVVSWLQGLNTSALQQRALRAAEAAQTMSDRTGLSAPFLRARGAFLKETEGQ